MEPDELKEITEQLKKLHAELTSELHRQKKEIGEEVEINDKDALPLKEEIEFIEQQDNIEEDEIHLVEEAMRRITDGIFGFCLDCGEPIPLERLQALPYAKCCIFCEEKREGQK